jgi:uncharacterized protein
MEIFAWLILILSFLVAALGVVIPGVPGLAVAFLGLIIFKLLMPGMIGWWVVVAVGSFTAVSWAMDLLSSFLGAKLGGASRLGLWGAAIGGFLGIFFAPLGLFAGPFFGAIIGDLFAKRTEILQLLRSGTGALLGFVFSLIVRLVLLILSAMFVIFALLPGDRL